MVLTWTRLKIDFNYFLKIQENLWRRKVKLFDLSLQYLIK